MAIRPEDFREWGRRGAERRWRWKNHKKHEACKGEAREKVSGPCCAAHRDRARVCVPASHTVNGEPLCRSCFNGRPVFRDELGGEEARGQSSARLKFRRAAPPRPKNPHSTPHEVRAKEFLLEFLTHGRRHSEAVMSAAARLGLGSATLYKVRKEVGVVVFRSGRSESWWAKTTRSKIPESL